MDISNKYIYNEIAVAFLDVLGFQNRLAEFEQEAIEFKTGQSTFSEADEEEINTSNGSFYYSQKANDFIETFNSAISKLNTEIFSYYLFSDNICITVRNDKSENSLIDLLLIISELYFEFAQKGYFLRGGIDYGLFIDKSSIALGVPLATAYKIESTQAVFPRIVLSKNFVKQFEVYSDTNTTDYSSILLESLIKRSCEIDYLNVFNHIFKVDNKEDFFIRFSSRIIENLTATSNNERVNIKFQWLANEFNSFIETYTASLAYFDVNFEATEEFISTIKQLKIGYGN